MNRLGTESAGGLLIKYSVCKCRDLSLILGTYT